MNIERGEIIDLININQAGFKLWNWKDAPPQYRALSMGGNNEDYVIFVKREAVMDFPPISQDGHIEIAYDNEGNSPFKLPPGYWVMLEGLTVSYCDWVAVEEGLVFILHRD